MSTSFQVAGLLFLNIWCTMIVLANYDFIYETEWWQIISSLAHSSLVVHCSYRLNFRSPEGPIAVSIVPKICYFGCMNEQLKCAWGPSTRGIICKWIFVLHALEILHLLNVCAWTTNIHLQMIPHVYLAPRSYSVLGNTRMLDKLTKVSRHISTVHSCNQNNKFFVTTT